MTQNKNLFRRTFVLIAYLGMIFVNYLANALPINGIDTGQISDNYPNLFAPIGFTFSIWGLIYLLLGIYSFYQFFKPQINEKLLNKINLYFILTSLINILWIFAWHYDFIGLSVLLMLVLLISLIGIADSFKGQSLSIKEKIIIKLPFSIYFGWITIATIANITILLVSLNWNSFGLSDVFWTIIVLLVGAIIGLLGTIKDKNIAYGLVFIWAYLGIYFKHISTSGFAGRYQEIIMTVVLCIFLFLIAEIFLLFKKLKND
jgi:hypothetical protein